MPHITVELDDNKDLIKALEGRTRLLEKLLSRKGLDIKDVSRMVEKSRNTDMKSFNKMASTLTSAISKIKQPKINVMQKDNSRALVSSFNKRIAVLEDLLRRTRNNKPVIVKTVVRNDNRKINVIEKKQNVILDSLVKGIRGGMSVVPSPS